MGAFRIAAGWPTLVAICALGILLTGCGPEPVGAVLKYEVVPTDARMGPIAIDDLADALNDRLRGIGRARAVNEQIEVDIFGDVDPARMESIRQRICGVGDLEFRIIADPMYPADLAIVNAAKLLSPEEKKVVLDGDVMAEWVTYAPAEFGSADANDIRVVKRLAGNEPEALVLIDALNVSGQYLQAAHKGVDSRDGPAINFSFDRKGAALFRLLTSQNKPNPATGAIRHLGILFDKRLICAPSIRETISDHGQISGGAMTEDEIDNIITILHCGRLPHPIREVVGK